MSNPPFRPKHRSLAATAALLICVTAAPAAEPPGPQSAWPGAQALDEVVVQGRRIELAQLRDQLIQLEDRYYARYNELNTRDIFDIHCADEARTGTRLERRYCRAEFEIRAFQQEGIEHYWSLFRVMGGESKTREAVAEWIPPAPPSLQIERRRAEFRRTMERVTRDNPELVDLLQQRAQLAGKYEKLLRGDAR